MIPSCRTPGSFPEQNDRVPFLSKTSRGYLPQEARAFGDRTRGHLGGPGRRGGLPVTASVPVCAVAVKRDSEYYKSSCLPACLSVCPQPVLLYCPFVCPKTPRLTPPGIVGVSRRRNLRLWSDISGASAMSDPAALCTGRLVPCNLKSKAREVFLGGTNSRRDRGILD